MGRNIDLSRKNYFGLTDYWKEEKEAKHCKVGDMCLPAERVFYILSKTLPLVRPPHLSFLIYICLSPGVTLGFYPSLAAVM